MKRTLISLIGIVSLSALADTQCQGTSLCLHTRMPLLNQGHPALIDIIKNNVSSSYESDLGNCAPTGSTMVYLTMVNDQYGNTPFYDENYLYQTVFKMGADMKTKWLSGGTSGDNIDRTLRSYTSNLVYNRLYSYEKRSKLLAQSEFGTRMPALSVEVRVPPKWPWQRSPAAHIVSLNGIEGWMYKIYDPWQRIYNVEVFSNKVYNPTGYGFISQYGPNIEVSNTYGGYQQSRNRGFGGVSSGGGYSGSPNGGDDSSSIYALKANRRRR